MDLEQNKNEDRMKQLLDGLKAKLDKVYEGGGKKNASKQKEQGKMLARERINYLIDKNSPSSSYYDESVTISLWLLKFYVS